MDFRDLHSQTLSNDNYRKVLFTTRGMQLVLMSLRPDEDIPSEIHQDTVQFIVVVRGRGEATIGRRTVQLKKGSSLMIPAGGRHYVRNKGRTNLKLYTIYSPPEYTRHKVNRRQPK